MLRKKLVSTLKSYVYARLLPLVRRGPEVLTVYPKDKNQLPILTVCDPMAWQNLSKEHAAVSIAPYNWQEAFDNTHNFEFFFCESAWTGATKETWRGQVYKDRRVFYENRRELLKILAKCKVNKIPTVFWAKEDPAYFRDATYDFTDTALKFDYILTTAEECISKYHALGHEQVYLWPFGFSPSIFYPPKDKEHKRENMAVFAGSWYENQPQRCKDLTRIFDKVLSANIPLRIYDRYRVGGRSSKPFPKRYQQYVYESISYTALGEVFRNVKYAINVNTVRDSSTMFARRVYEAMACGAIVISNPSVGMRKQFDNNVWFISDDFAFDHIDAVRQRNIETVFANHTWEQRMEQLLAMIGCDQSV